MSPVSSVLVCRGCCCGSATKHPEMDHDGQTSRLRAATAAVGARFNTTDCLGPCERANVVVIRDGQRRRWLGDLGDADVDALAEWIAAPDTDELPAAIVPHVFGGPSSRARRRLLPDKGSDLVAVLTELVRAPGTWTMGVPGAIAEFDTSNESPHVVVDATGDTATITAGCGTGSMRLDVEASTRTFAFGHEVAAEELELHAIVRTGAGLTPQLGLTELGPDPAPIGDVADDDLLFDLGLGRQPARFMIRTGDAELTDILRRVAGTPVSKIDPAVWQAIIEASPTRVVETALGRIEVTAPIPPAGGVSPAGCHTHLLPTALAEGLDLPHGIDIPKGWQVGLLHYPGQPSAE
ncbi:MAG: (2Fe-2S) ferredoxin domain-containing protein [Actinomycetota bacterium]